MATRTSCRTTLQPYRLACREKLCNVDERWSAFDSLGPLGHPPGERRESIVVGHVAMATDHRGRRTLLMGGVWSPLWRKWPLGTGEETATGLQTACPLHGALRRVGKVDERGKMVRDSPVGLQLKVLQAVALHIIAQWWVDPAFSMVRPWFVKQLWLGKDCGSNFRKSKVTKEELFCIKVSTLLALGTIQYFGQFYRNIWCYHSIQILERSMDINTCAVNTMKRKHKLAIRTTMYKIVYQKKCRY